MDTANWAEPVSEEEGEQLASSAEASTRREGSGALVIVDALLIRLATKAREPRS
jgi:hypothetical protein